MAEMEAWFYLIRDDDGSLNLSSGLPAGRSGSRKLVRRVAVGPKELSVLEAQLAQDIEGALELPF